MKDFVGNKLEVGDTVVFSRYHVLQFGVVVKLNPDTVTLDYEVEGLTRGTVTYRSNIYPNNIYKLGVKQVVNNTEPITFN